jgi:hypothetical protein
MAAACLFLCCYISFVLVMHGALGGALNDQQRPVSSAERWHDADVLPWPTLGKDGRWLTAQGDGQLSTAQKLPSRVDSARASLSLANETEVDQTMRASLSLANETEVDQTMMMRPYSNETNNRMLGKALLPACSKYKDVLAALGTGSNLVALGDDVPPRTVQLNSYDFVLFETKEQRRDFGLVAANGKSESRVRKQLELAFSAGYAAWVMPSGGGGGGGGGGAPALAAACTPSKDGSGCVLAVTAPAVYFAMVQGPNTTPRGTVTKWKDEATVLLQDFTCEKRGTKRTREGKAIDLLPIYKLIINATPLLGFTGQPAQREERCCAQQSEQ